jgi:hypothetical protein
MIRFTGSLGGYLVERLVQADLSSRPERRSLHELVE